MEKKLYDLKIDGEFAHLLPTLNDDELHLLTDSLIDEGCRDSLVTWNGVIVDGHNRYRICHEHGIPFTYIEKEFDSRDQAKLWIITTQMSRRNLTSFIKCEMVMPLEALLRAEAKKRQGTRNDLKKSTLNPSNFEIETKTREHMARLAGVSGRTFDKAKKLFISADEDTKQKLRNGELSIHGAYIQMISREETKTNDSAPHTHTVKPKQPEPQVRLTDQVSNAPPEDMDLRGRAEYYHASAGVRRSTECYVQNVSKDISGMSSASINDENIKELKAIVTEGYEKIITLLNSKCSV